jgi:hypothetical protein
MRLVSDTDRAPWRRWSASADGTKRCLTQTGATDRNHAPIGGRR